jgi:nitrogen-specific signal transduction histidine kinase/CheY-like chemotaxis protein
MTERRSLELQLQQSQKLESIGMLAGGVAHDFNNMLSVILGYGQMLQIQLGADHAAAPRLEQIVAAGERAAKLTRQLLAFSRRQVLNPTLLDLNAVLTHLAGMLRRLIRENIELVLQLPPALGTVYVDAGQIEQVVVNLVINAGDAMPSGGRLVLSTADVVVSEARDLQGGRIEPGAWVVLSVEDSGVGMEPATQARLFEPFFTTKAPGRGTGLGLATVHGIVRQSGGHVTFESQVGRGSTFQVHLPRAQGAPSQPAPAPGSPATTQGAGTILLVEDQQAVREFAQAALSSTGYRVLAAADAAQAEQLARGSATPIDLLLTDVVMPGASGTELAARLAGRHPGLRVVLMSGYPRGAAGGPGVLQPGQTLLEKPLTFEGLAHAVSEALRTRPDPGPKPAFPAG